MALYTYMEFGGIRVFAAKAAPSAAPTCLFGLICGRSRESGLSAAVALQAGNQRSQENLVKSQLTG